MATRNCEGNCLGCSFQQQTYCSAQRTYALMKNQETLFSRINNIEEAITALRTAFERFCDAPVVNPFEKPSEKEKAQKGGGAENRSPEL